MSRSHCTEPRTHSSSRHSSSSSRSHGSRDLVRSRSPSGSSCGSSSGSLYTRSDAGRSRGSNGIGAYDNRRQFPTRDSMERNIECPRYTSAKEKYTGKDRYFTSDVSPKFVNSDMEDWESAAGHPGNGQYMVERRYTRSPSPPIRSRRPRSPSPSPPVRSRRSPSPHPRPHSPPFNQTGRGYSSSPEPFQARRPTKVINKSPPRRAERCPTPPMPIIPNRRSMGSGSNYNTRPDSVLNTAAENWDDGPTVNVNIKRNYSTGYAVVQPPWRKRPYESHSHAPSVSNSHRHNPSATAIETTKSINNVPNSVLENWESANSPPPPRQKSKSPNTVEPLKVKIKKEKMDEDDNGVVDGGIKIKVEKLDDEVKIKIEKVDEDEVGGSPPVDKEDGEIEPGEATPTPPRECVPSPSPSPPPPRPPPRSPSPEPLLARRIRKSVNDPDFVYQEPPPPTKSARNGSWRSGSDFKRTEPLVRYPNFAHELSDPSKAPVTRFPNSAHELSDPKSFEKKKFFKRRPYQKYEKHGTYGFDVNIDTEEPDVAEPLLPPPPPIPTMGNVTEYTPTYQVPQPRASPHHQEPIYNTLGVATLGVGPLGLLPHQIATLLPHQLAALVQMVPVHLQPQFQSQVPIRTVQLPSPPQPQSRTNGYATQEMPRRVVGVTRVSGDDENWEEGIPLRNGSLGSSRGPSMTASSRGKDQAPAGYHIVPIHNQNASAAGLVRKNAVVFDYGHGSSNGFSH